MALHLLDSLSYLNLLQFSTLYQELTQYKFYPPLVSWVALPFYKAFGVSIAAAVFSNTVWLSILAFSTYGVGRRLWTRGVGLLGAFFVLTSPMIVSTSKEFMLDLPLTAIVALALYLLVRSQEFSDRSASLWLGPVMGLGALAKWTFALIFALPFAWALGNAAVRDVRLRRFSGTANALWALLLAYVVASVWYLPNWQAFHHDATRNADLTLGKPGLPGVGSLTSDLWYAWDLLRFKLFLIPLLFFLAGVGVALMVQERVGPEGTSWRRQALRRNAYPLLLIIGTYLFFSFLTNKDARYTLPLMVGVAIVATYWLTLVASRWRAWLTAFLVAYGTVVFLAISFGTSLLPRDIFIHNGRYPLTLFGQRGYIIGPPSHEQWHMVDMFDAIRSDPRPPPRALMYVGPDTIWFNFIDLLYYGQRYQTSVNYELTQGPAVPSSVGPPASGFLAVRAAAGSVGSPPSGVRQVREWGLPDHTVLILYRRA
jgi:4-amino-4-deoxy-L-arabinose transferase-like glycosyltransferase